MLFSLNGRARRRHLFFLIMLSGFSGLLAKWLKMGGLGERTVSVVTTSIGLLMAYIAFAMLVRRLHDFDWSGWWAVALYGFAGLVMLGVAVQPQQDYGGSFEFLMWTFHPVPSTMTTLLTVAFCASILLFLTIFLAHGTRGPNRYGPDLRSEEPEAPDNAATKPL